MHLCKRLLPLHYNTRISSTMEKVISFALKIIRKIIFSIGIFFLIIFILSFTSLPFWAIHWLGVDEGTPESPPDLIVLMGGAGMPSENGLLRSYHCATVAGVFHESKIIIALPGDAEDTTSSVYLMSQELTIRGIDRDRISFETKGTNTRMQALEIYSKYQMLSDTMQIAIVTSAEHMKRSVLAFRKAGFKKVGGYSAFEQALESDFLFDDDELGGNQLVPDVGGSTQLRYQFWNHLQMEVIFLREYTALIYYKLKGWI